MNDPCNDIEHRGRWMCLRCLEPVAIELRIGETQVVAPPKDLGSPHNLDRLGVIGEFNQNLQLMILNLIVELRAARTNWDVIAGTLRMDKEDLIEIYGRPVRMQIERRKKNQVDRKRNGL